MCRYEQKLMVHLRIADGPHLLYQNLLDLGTEAVVRDEQNHHVADDLFLPKDVEHIGCSDVRRLMLAGYEKTAYVGERKTCRKGRIRTGRIDLISWDLKIGEFSASYDCGRLNIYSGGLVISEKVDVPELEKFPINAELLRSEMKRRLTEFHKNQLEKINKL